MLYPQPSTNPVLSDPTFLATLQHSYAISVIAPASGISKDKLKRLQNLPQTCLKFYTTRPIQTPSPYHSANNISRLVELSTALKDPHTRILWALRGGYGVAPLLPLLDRKILRQQHKLLIGYSDITALHLVYSHLGLKSIHGAMVSELLDPKKNPDNFRLLGKILTGDSLDYSGLIPMNQAAKKANQIKGRLIGGNLAIVATSIGTNWQLRAQGKIVMLEDVGEPGYVIDRTLTHLIQAGILRGAKAILLGEFNGGDENVSYALQRFANQQLIPVYRANFFGHGRCNYPLIFGTNSIIYKTSLHNLDFHLYNCSQ